MYIYNKIIYRYIFFHNHKNRPRPTDGIVLHSDAAGRKLAGYYTVNHNVIPA